MKWWTQCVAGLAGSAHAENDDGDPIRLPLPGSERQLRVTMDGNRRLLRDVAATSRDPVVGERCTAALERAAALERRGRIEDSAALLWQEAAIHHRLRPVGREARR